MSQDTSQAMNAGTEYAMKSTIQKGQTIALLLQMLNRLALEGIRSLLGGNKKAKERDNSIADTLQDYLPNGKRRSLGKSKSITRRLGNKTRGAIRFAKNARRLKTVAKAGKMVKTAGKLKTASKLAKTANVAKNAGKIFKMGRNAKKAHTAIKLAQAGRIAVTGGAALAGGPVGIALLAGSVLAPYAIEAVWKNREKIYEGSKDLVTKSKLAAEDIGGLIAGKNAKEGDLVPEAKGLKVTGAGQQTLLEIDDGGKVLANNFTPDQKLAFYQENEGEKTMLLDEAEVIPDAKQQTAPTAPGEQTGLSVAQNTLNQLAQNNPNNPQIQAETRMLGNNLEAANENSLATQTGKGNNAIALNEAGSSIIDLFNSQVPADRRNQALETEDYTIFRRGKDYFLNDKAGNNLLQATNTGFGTKIVSSNLDNSHMKDLAYLKQDLRLNEGITGGFEPLGLVKTKDILKSPTALENPNVSESATAAISQMATPANGKSPIGNTVVGEPAQNKAPSVEESVSKQGETRLPPPPPAALKQEKAQTAFSQYLPQNEKVSAVSGNSKESTKTDLER